MRFSSINAFFGQKCWFQFIFSKNFALLIKNKCYSTAVALQVIYSFYINKCLMTQTTTHRISFPSFKEVLSPDNFIVKGFCMAKVGLTLFTERICLTSNAVFGYCTNSKLFHYVTVIVFILIFYYLYSTRRIPTSNVIRNLTMVSDLSVIMRPCNSNYSKTSLSRTPP